MTNEAAYWAGREATKQAALKMAAALSAREKGYLVRTVKNAETDEVKHDQTMQRLFEKSFLSMDCPNEDGTLFDYSCGNREVERLVSAIDEPYDSQQRKLRRKSLFEVAYRALEEYPELQKTLLAIRRFSTREKIFFALQIKGGTYRERFSQLTKILKSRLGI